MMTLEQFRSVARSELAMADLITPTMRHTRDQWAVLTQCRYRVRHDLDVLSDNASQDQINDAVQWLDRLASIRSAIMQKVELESPLCLTQPDPNDDLPGPESFSGFTDLRDLPD